MVISKYGKNVHFYIWLDRTYSYVVPNPDFIEKGFSSYFSTPMVFDAAEAGDSKYQRSFWFLGKIRTENSI